MRYDNHKTNPLRSAQRSLLHRSLGRAAIGRRDLPKSSLLKVTADVSSDGLQGGAVGNRVPVQK
jgi:hypothetical protein